MKKKIVIVGGGISGLTAGIYAQKNGFDSIILEKHAIAGGECTGWDRQGFHIDNCIHWMTGTLPTKQLHRVWEEVGALGPDIPLIQNEAFMRIDGRDGRQIHVWRDINRLESELLESFPEDRREIRRLIKAIRGYQDIEVFSEKPFERFTLKDNLKALWSLRRVIRPHIRYSKISVRQYIRLFHSPLLRDVIRSYLPETYYVEAILYMYATFASGNGDLPAGGSLQMAERMVRRYEQLGGQLRTQAEVSHIVIEQGHATGVMLRKGEFIGADYIVAACDANVTFSRLLPDAFFDDYFRRRYKEQKNYPLFSNFNVYFGCDCTLRHLPDMISFRTEPYEICGKQHDILFVKQYGYEPGFAPEGKTVIQSLTLQFERDFDRWQHLRETDPAAYREEKLRAAQ
ncbi:MAG: NAD(P)/FAD-dependent oxidoreductase, partial [Paludibacteraceae bacterium]|nr:NAD(P)/FAD-dependent oxidoreductase [Paludibacteraceae bacterium]